MSAVLVDTEASWGTPAPEVPDVEKLASKTPAELKARSVAGSLESLGITSIETKLVGVAKSARKVIPGALPQLVPNVLPKTSVPVETNVSVLAKTAGDVTPPPEADKMTPGNTVLIFVPTGNASASMSTSPSG